MINCKKQCIIAHENCVCRICIYRGINKKVNVYTRGYCICTSKNIVIRAYSDCIRFETDWVRELKYGKL